MGKVHEAIAQYERCKRVLAAELGTQPSAELQLTRMNLAAPRAASSPPAGAPETPAMVTSEPPNAPVSAPPLEEVPDSRMEMPLVGREPELTAMSKLVADTARGIEHRA